MPVVEDAVDLIGLALYLGLPLIGSVVLGRFALQQKQVEARIAELERLLAETRADLAASVESKSAVEHLLRVAVRHIRDWVAWQVQHAPETPAPALPPELVDEV
ncbi:hypothetical protein [Gordonia malaquae]|uniref:hypothetical protein n=1 Tax=Gordonia malaquae TaxID=410332 RepID=UPI003017C757